eukprot:m.352804 g.352804  ORF g.352804 m.352804 type:complete len:460 (+) comp16615_c0_seq1:2433-3812(+)
MEVVSYGLLANCLVHGFDDEISSFSPTQMTQHHLPRKNHTARVHLVEVGILGCGAMGSLKDGVTGLVVDVSSWCNANTTNLGCKSIGKVVPVQVHGCNHIKRGGTGQNLLKRNVSNSILHQQHVLPLTVGMSILERTDHIVHFVNEALLLSISHEVEPWLNRLCIFSGIGDTLVKVVQNPAFTLSNHLGTKVVDGNFVTPLLETTLSELHDVALVNQGKALASVFKSILDSRLNKTSSSFLGHWLDAKTTGAWEADLACDALLLEKLDQVCSVSTSCFKLNTSIDIFCVLTKDHHVDILWLLDWAWYALEPHHRTKAHVEIKGLTKGDIERADATTDGCGQWTLDTDKVLAVSIKSCFWEPLACLTKGLLASKDFKPLDLFLATVGLLNSIVEDVLSCTPDIWTGTVTFNEWNHWIVWYLKGTISTHGDGRSSTSLDGCAHGSGTGCRGKRGSAEHHHD